MKLERRKPSGRERDEASMKLLAQLRDKLYSDRVAIARRAAFNLSWMQEDGLAVLKEALFSEAARRAKSAATYGLRKMRGRMKKMALEVLSQGLKHSDSTTAEVCENALLVLRKGAGRKSLSKGKTRAGKFEIRDVSAKSRQSRRRQKVGRQRNSSPK